MEYDKEKKNIASDKTILRKIILIVMFGVFF